MKGVDWAVRVFFVFWVLGSQGFFFLDNDEDEWQYFRPLLSNAAHCHSSNVVPAVSCFVAVVVAAAFACRYAFAACLLVSVSAVLAFGWLLSFLARLLSSPVLVSFVTLFAVPPLLTLNLTKNCSPSMNGPTPDSLLHQRFSHEKKRSQKGAISGINFWMIFKFQPRHDFYIGIHDQSRIYFLPWHQ